MEFEVNTALRLATAEAVVPEWRAELLLNSKGVPLGNLANVLTALRNAPAWRGVPVRLGRLGGESV
jgi:hypothetical protein